MKYKILLLFCFFSVLAEAQTDTILHRKHYNAVRYYPYFDYKCNDTVKNHYVIGIGNVIDSVKTGRWTYYLPDGRILATGKYKNGIKRGRWEYRDASIVLFWEKSANARDYIGYNYRNGMAEIIDIVNTENVYYKVINGITIHNSGIRFL